MSAIKTRIRIDPDHHISGTAPAVVPAGEHEATITIDRPRSSTVKLRVADLPTHEVLWDGSVSLSRDDIYDDNGR